MVDVGAVFGGIISLLLIVLFVLIAKWLEEIRDDVREIRRRKCGEPRSTYMRQ